VSGETAAGHTLRSAAASGGAIFKAFFIVVNGYIVTICNSKMKHLVRRPGRRDAELAQQLGHQRRALVRPAGAAGVGGVRGKDVVAHRRAYDSPINSSYKYEQRGPLDRESCCHMDAAAQECISLQVSLSPTFP
jgi:hypothetical protein